MSAMPRSFWTEIAVSVMAVVGAAVAYWADIDYLPSILIIVAALMVTGIFAEIEDKLIQLVEGSDAQTKKRYLLVLMRVVRALLLLVMAIATVALIL